MVRYSCWDLADSQKDRSLACVEVTNGSTLGPARCPTTNTCDHLVVPAGGGAPTAVWANRIADQFVSEMVDLNVGVHE